jgi:hypothetical protein
MKAIVLLYSVIFLCLSCFTLSFAAQEWYSLSILTFYTVFLNSLNATFPKIKQDGVQVFLNSSYETFVL